MFARVSLKMFSEEETTIDEEEKKKKKRRKHTLPDPVTIPLRGPLLLRGREKKKRSTRSSRRQPQHSSSTTTTTGLAPIQSRKLLAPQSLNRFPVFLIRRPLDEIDDVLGHLSCSLLQEQVEEIQSQERMVKLPHLHPMMKYSPINNGLHGNHNLATLGNRAAEEVGTKSRPLPLPLPLPPSSPTFLISSPYDHQPCSTTPPHPSPLPPTLQDQITSSYLQSLPPPLPPPTSYSSHLPHSSIRGSSLAPPSLQAAMTHLRKPLTQQTTIQGHRIFI